MTDLSAERLLQLLAHRPNGITQAELVQVTGCTRGGAGNALVRHYEQGTLIRSGVGNKYHPYVYGPTPAPSAPRPLVLSPHAHAALGVVRQLTHPSAATLAAQHGCSYMQGRKLWAELIESGAVSA